MSKCPITDYEPPEYCDNQECYFKRIMGCAIILAAKTSCENQDDIKSIKKQLDKLDKSIEKIKEQIVKLLKNS